MGGGVPVQPLKLERNIDQIRDLFIIAALLAQIFFAFQRLSNRCRVCWIVRDQFGNAIHLRIGHLKHPSYIA